MRIITTTAGTRVELDGDVIGVVDAIRQALIRQRELDYSFEDVERELTNVVELMTEEELRTYLKESLGITFLRYENQQLEKLMKKAHRAKDE